MELMIIRTELLKKTLFLFSNHLRDIEHIRESEHDYLLPLKVSLPHVPVPRSLSVDNKDLNLFAALNNQSDIPIALQTMMRTLLSGLHSPHSFV